jgi:hypothetical protein
MSCRIGLNGPSTGPDRAELNESCRARPMGCRLGPSTGRLVLQAGSGPLPVVLGRAQAGPNHAGRGPAHLPRAKFSGLPTILSPHSRSLIMPSGLVSKSPPRQRCRALGQNSVRLCCEILEAHTNAGFVGKFKSPFELGLVSGPGWRRKFCSIP